MSSIKVILVVPALAPAVTKPVLSTVAIAALDDVHGFDKADELGLLNCEVAPAQAERVPLITGKGSTVSETVAVQPLLSV